MFTLKNSLLVCLLTSLLACAHSPAQQVRTQQQKTAAGNLYSLFYPQGLSIQVVTSRPNPNDGRTQLSIAAAYTGLDTNTPLDLLVDNGSVRQATVKVGGCVLKL